jgi:hypothetical protein
VRRRAAACSSNRFEKFRINAQNGLTRLFQMGRRVLGEPLWTRAAACSGNHFENFIFNNQNGLGPDFQTAAEAHLACLKYWPWISLWS